MNDICNKSGTLTALLSIKVIFKILLIAVPIIIIITSIINTVNVVKTGSEEEAKKQFSILIKKITAAIIVFITPTLIIALMNILLDFSNEENTIKVCFENATREKIIELKAQEKANKDENAKPGIDRSDTQTIGPNKGNNDNNNNNNNNGNNGNTGGDTNTQSGSNENRQSVGNGKYFDSNDVTKISGLSESEFIQVLENSTAYHGKAKVYIPLAHDLILAEKNHGVNAFYLIGLYSYESGWLGSTLTKQCNNIGGVRYYNQTYGNGKKTTNCYKKYAGFDSIGEFIDFHANLLETKYLTPGASHYHGTSVASVAQDYGSGNGINTIIEIATKVSGGNLSQ